MIIKSKKVGKYQIQYKKVIGKGSFATVYEGIDQSSGQIVAVKVIQKEKLIEENDSKQLFLEQIKILQLLKSPNVIQLLNFYQTQNNYYVVQQMANQGTLYQLLKTKGKIPEEQALGYFEQILNGFIELIKHGISHRDLKPQNILLKNGILKIADFGLSKRYQSEMISPVGSPLYMPPESLKCEPYTSKCDIWSLGIILYELIVGQTPWKTSRKFLQTIMKKQIQYPTQIKISQKTKSFIGGCLKKKQAQRCDWRAIYKHELFASKFEEKTRGLQLSGKTNVAFIMSSLKDKINQGKIDIKMFIDQQPTRLNFQAFKSLINHFGQSDEHLIHTIYRQCRQYYQAKYLRPNQVLQFLQLYGVQSNCSYQDASTVESHQSEQQFHCNNDTQSLVSSMKQQISNSKLDIHDIFALEDRNHRNGLSLEQFKSLVLKFCNFKDSQIKFLHKYFDKDGNSLISFKQFFKVINESNQISLEQRKKLRKLKTLRL